MTTLTDQDLAMIVRRLPADLRKLMREHRLFIAGGFIREVICGGAVQDIDVFGIDKEFLRTRATDIAYCRQPGSRLHETQYAFTVFCPPRAPVQFIYKWAYDDPLRLMSELDFTVCQAVVWFEEGLWRSACSELFYSDLAARRLRYTFPDRAEAAGGSLMRVRKFLARGYNIQVDSLAGVVARLIGGIKEERLGALMHGEGALSLERARHKVLKGLLHEVDPLSVVDAVEPREEEEQ